MQYYKSKTNNYPENQAHNNSTSNFFKCLNLPRLLKGMSLDD